MSAMEIVVRRDGKEYGPYPLSAVTDYLNLGQLDSEDEARLSGETTWQQLGKLLTSPADASSTPPPPPPSFSEVTIHRNGTAFGPYTLDVARDYVEKGSLSREELATPDGSTQQRLLGDILDEDDTRTFHATVKAANQGGMNAQADLAQMYWKGRGVKKNVPEAIRLYRQAAEQGHIEACMAMSGIYLMGKEVAQDLDEADRWDRRARGLMRGEDPISVFKPKSSDMPTVDNRHEAVDLTPTTEPADVSSYKMETLSNGKVKFSVIGERSKQLIAAPLYLSFLFAFGGLYIVASALDAVFRVQSDFGVAVLLGMGMLFAIYVFRFVRRKATQIDAKKRKCGGTFVASSSGIQTASQFIPMDDIHRLVVTNTFAEVVMSSGAGGFIVGGKGPLGFTTAMTSVAVSGAFAVIEESKRRRLKHLTEIAYMLNVEHGGKQTTLAGGMDVPTVNGLLQEVGKVLRFS